MCTMLFIGSDRPFEMGPPETDGGVAPAPARVVPPILSDCAHVAELVDWHDGRPFCSCAFIETSLPWEPNDEAPETVAAFDVLRALSLEHGASLRVFGTDDADADRPPNVTCRVAPEHIRAGMILFNIPFQGGEVPRILVEIVPGLPVPDKPETLGVL